MADDLFFFDMDLDNWHDGRAQTVRSFEELHTDLSHLNGGEDVVDLRLLESASGYGQLSYFHEPGTVRTSEPIPSGIGTDSARGIRDSLLGKHPLSAGQLSIKQVKEMPYASFRPADVVDNDPDQWTTLLQKMTFVQDFVDTNETLSNHPESNSQPESPPPWTKPVICDVAAAPEHPEQPYNQLLYDCLMSAPHQEMRLCDIYEWMKANTTKVLSVNESGWKNSIRHNLSMNPAFKQGCRSSESVSIKHMWMLTDEAIRHGFIQSTTRYRGRSARGPSGKSTARNRTFTERRGNSKKTRPQEGEAPPRHSRNDSLYSTHPSISSPSVSSWQTPLLAEQFMHEVETPASLNNSRFDQDRDLCSTPQTTPFSLDTKSFPLANQHHAGSFSAVPGCHTKAGGSYYAPSSPHYGSPSSVASSQYGSLEDLPIYLAPEQSIYPWLIKPSPTPYRSVMDAAAMLCDHGDFAETCSTCSLTPPNAGTFDVPLPAHAISAQAQDYRLWQSYLPAIGDSVQPSFLLAAEKQKRHLTVDCYVAGSEQTGTYDQYNHRCQSATDADSADTKTGVEIFSGYEADDEAFPRNQPYNFLAGGWYADLPMDSKHGSIL